MALWQTPLFWLLTIISGLLTLYGFYFVAMALFSFGAGKSFPGTRPSVRFAVLIPARNEEKVIGHLVDSLKKQNYPPSLVDIMVAPNHCTDRTAQIALAHGARIIAVQTSTYGKGDVLKEAIDALLAAPCHDAICVFDADNLVHPDFLQHMNDAYHQGVSVATSTRDSKNPTDSPTAFGSSMIYWLLSRFYNKCRERLGLSSLVSGSGFMVTMAYLQSQGGWHTQTLTEDYEFSAQCVLAGSRVHYVEKAIIYDEQPTAFRHSWRQRRRWTTGYLQGMRKYLGMLLACGLRCKSKPCMDVAMTFMQPIVMIASFVTLIPGLGFFFSRAAQLEFGIPCFPLYLLLGLCAVVYGLLCSFALYMVRRHSDRPIKSFATGILYYPLFLSSWLFVMLASVFRKETRWQPTPHTVAIDVDDVVT